MDTLWRRRDDGRQSRWLGRAFKVYSERGPERNGGKRVAEVVDQIRDLARHAHVSERTFARRFVTETGMTPLQWLLRQRVLAARELLETTSGSVDEIATRCGFGTTASLSAHFRRHVATTPTAYRNAFAARR